MLVRLHKHMADQWIASRRKSEEFITKWYVKVNGIVVTELWTKIDPEKDKIEIDWLSLESEKRKLVYYLLNKPVWYVTTTHRTKFEIDIVTDLVPENPRVYPIGRLDKDTTGLLIMTNDWDLTYKLMHPSFEHEKEYEVLFDDKLFEKDLEELWNWSIVLDWRTVQRAKIEPRSNKSFSIVLKEGMNRQIRRMAEAIWYRVKKLRRIRMWNIMLWELAIWQYRLLTKKEIEELKMITGK